MWSSYTQSLSSSDQTRNMSTTIPNMPRRRHKDLQPLATSHDLAHGHEGRASILSGVTSTNTNAALPSPSVLAAREYFLETSPPIGQNSNALQRRRTLIEAQEFPKRHSIMPLPGGLATKMASFTVSCPDQNLELMREIPKSEPLAKIKESEDVSMAEVKQSDLVKMTAGATAVRSQPVRVPEAEILPQAPFQYTHDRLRDWGYAYLGNTATADAFINPVSLRRPSLAIVKEGSGEDRPQSTGMVTIRARVHPRAKERKPFLIQRQFDMEELRASTPATQRPAERVSSPLRRSHRTRRSSAQLLPNANPRRESTRNSVEMLAPLQKGAVPIRK